MQRSMWANTFERNRTMSEIPSGAVSEPKHLVIASYPDEDRAAQVLVQIKQARSATGLGTVATKWL